jgi:hypothetical protein
MSLQSRTRRLQRELEVSYQLVLVILRDHGEAIKKKREEGLSLADADRVVVTEELQRRGQKVIR